MNLWEKLEQRGRDELKLGESWFLFAVDLDKSGYGYAEVKFSRKNEYGDFRTPYSDCPWGNIKYSNFQ